MLTSSSFSSAGVMRGGRVFGVLFMIRAQSCSRVLIRSECFAVSMASSSTVNRGRAKGNSGLGVEGNLVRISEKRASNSQDLPRRPCVTSPRYWVSGPNV